MQVIRHDVIPDQIVGAHPVEHTCGVLTVEHALPRGTFPRRLNGVVSHEQTGHRIFGVRVEHVDHQRQRRDSIGAAKRRHVTERGRQRDPAGARADGGHAAMAGDFARRFDARFDRVDVPGQSPVAELCGRIAPRHHEHLESRIEQESHQTLLGRQVVDVVLVDLRRHDEHRSRFDVRRARPILHQLEHRMAQHHRPFGIGEVAADGERCLVDLRRHAAVVDQVVDEVARAFDEALSARFAGFLERRRIAEQEVRRHQSVGGEPEQEVRALASEVVEPDRVHPFVHGALRRHPRLRRALVETVLAERGIAKARVLRIRRCVGCTEQNPHRFLPQPRGVLDADRRLQQTLTHHADAGLHDVVEAEADDGIQRERAVGRGFFGMRRCPIGFGHWSSPCSSKSRFTRRDYSRESHSI